MGASIAPNSVVGAGQAVSRRELDPGSRVRQPLIFGALAALGLVVGLGIAHAVPPSGASVLARGSHAVLTQEAADAFHESLLFSLGYVGHADARAALPRDTVRSQLAEVFPSLSATDQRVLASQPLLWKQAQARWDDQPIEDRQRYVTTLLTFAFGDAATGAGEFDLQDLPGTKTALHTTR